MKMFNVGQRGILPLDMALRHGPSDIWAQWPKGMPYTVLGIHGYFIVIHLNGVMPDNVPSHPWIVEADLLSGEVN